MNGESAESCDGLLWTKMPYQVLSLLDIPLPKGYRMNVTQSGDRAVAGGSCCGSKMVNALEDCNTYARARACWQAACGCYRVANKDVKGVTTVELARVGLQCTGQCSKGARKTNTRCYCYVKACPVCASVGSERHKMLQVMKGLVAKLSEQTWYVLVEAPLTVSVPKQAHASRHHDGVDKTKKISLKADVLLVLSVADAETSFGDCMIGIELDGTSHRHAFPVSGCRHKGARVQEEYDDNKSRILAGCGIECLRLSMSCSHEYEYFAERLSQEMQRHELIRVQKRMSVHQRA